MNEGEENTHLLAKQSSNSVQIIRCQQYGPTPFPQQLGVCSRIVQRDSRGDMFPRTMLRRDASTSQRLLPRHCVVYRPKFFGRAFGFGDGLVVANGQLVGNSIQPVFHAVPICQNDEGVVMIAKRW
ncbi:uncharacterized protein LDX57_011394 [Aspergillus melleus]|uniref:uncharacterized protein n=1 Tax=Aspergillus melleus TaxID=138277 RepID=UPI001E8DA3BA|nr:uncharacterized protein LDX57_011394 [Aspergillus melleus]KAH8433760.1 hypothetical protein LDX57_011394 [Aspergillus melleus]